jgi:hypothetical protein
MLLRRSYTHAVMADGRRVAIVMLVLAGVVFLVLGWSRFSAPFGDSDEGINGAVWGAASRAVREDGIIESRLGGIRGDGTRYATHPPLIIVETALVESVLGEHPWVTRAPAWLGALASLPLLYVLLRRLGPGPVAAAAATVAAVGCHMFGTYGGMLDTMVIAFPWAVAVLIGWQRQWTREQPWPPGARFLLALAAALAGWQAMLLVGVCGLALAGRVRTRGTAAIVEGLPELIAAALAATATLAWGVWVHGSFTVLREKLTRRTGGEDQSLADMVAFQLPWLAALLGLGLVAWIACAVSLRDERFRPVAAVALISVVLYPVILREGAAGHQFWNYWGLLPAAIGWGYLAGRAESRVPVPALIAGAVVIAGINLVQPDRAAALINEGIRTYQRVDAAALAEGQETIPYVGEPYRLDDWLRYRRGPPGQPLRDADQLRALARDRPDDLVVIVGDCADPDPTAICVPLTYGPGAEPSGRLPTRLATAREVAAGLP